MLGPHDIRLSPHMLPRLTVTGPGDVLLVVENWQAAEAVCDARADLPVVWCHGQPPDAVVSMIVQAAQQTSGVVICTDADLGGVRITARIHDKLRSDTTIHVVDVGTVPHEEVGPSTPTAATTCSSSHNARMRSAPSRNAVCTGDTRLSRKPQPGPPFRLCWIAIDLRPLAGVGHRPRPVAQLRDRALPARAGISDLGHLPCYLHQLFGQFFNNPKVRRSQDLTGAGLVVQGTSGL